MEWILLNAFSTGRFLFGQRHSLLQGNTNFLDWRSNWAEWHARLHSYKVGKKNLFSFDLQLIEINLYDGFPVMYLIIFLFGKVTVWKQYLEVSVYFFIKVPMVAKKVSGEISVKYIYSEDLLVNWLLSGLRLTDEWDTINTNLFLWRMVWMIMEDKWGRGHWDYSFWNRKF